MYRKIIKSISFKGNSKQRRIAKRIFIKHWISPNYKPFILEQESNLNLFHVYELYQSN